MISGDEGIGGFFDFYPRIPKSPLFGNNINENLNR